MTVVKLLILLSIILSTLAGGWAGIKLLGIAKRTQKWPELLIGLGLVGFVVGQVGLTILRVLEGRGSPSLASALVVVAEKDSLIDGRAVRKAARRMSASTLMSLPVGHFALYVGDPFETVVTAQVEFLVKHLGVATADDEAVLPDSAEPACATPHLA